MYRDVRFAPIWNPEVSGSSLCCDVEGQILHCVQNDTGRVTIAIDYGLCSVENVGFIVWSWSIHVV
jgi:hypothetical protein